MIGTPSGTQRGNHSGSIERSSSLLQPSVREKREYFTSILLLGTMLISAILYLLGMWLAALLVAIFWIIGVVLEGIRLRDRAPDLSPEEHKAKYGRTKTHIEFFGEPFMTQHFCVLAVSTEETVFDQLISILEEMNAGKILYKRRPMKDEAKIGRVLGRTEGLYIGITRAFFEIQPCEEGIRLRAWMQATDLPLTEEHKQRLTRGHDRIFKGICSRLTNSIVARPNQKESNN